MDDIIRKLYGDSEFVNVYFTTKSLPTVNYQLVGLGDMSKSEYADQWKLTGGVEGTFEYSICGKVSDPELWKDYRCELQVNSLGSGFRAEHETEGFIGDGWCKEDSVLLRLYVKPSIARDILDKIFYFNKLEDKDDHSFRCDLIGLEPGKKILEGAIVYSIVSLHC